MSTINNYKIEIRSANMEDFDIALEILNASFCNDPVLSWLVPDPIERPKMINEFFQIYLKHGLNNGTVCLASIAEMGVVGVSIWAANDAQDENIDNDMLQIAGSLKERFHLFGEIMHSHYPPVDPYQQLMATGVSPSAHGCGIGSALLAHRLYELDCLGIPSYLEATTRRVAGGLYSRFGYQPIGEPIRFPGGVEAYPMWRPVQEPNPVSYTLRHSVSQKYPLVDSIIHFGDYDWRVLDVQDDKALLLSENIVEFRKFHEKYEPVTWESSTLRQYLNEVFYHTFNKEEQSKILQLPIGNYSNPWFGTDCGGTTEDKIFLLGIEGVVKYFGDSRQLRSRNANTRYFIGDHFNDARKAVDKNGISVCWWLRTSGNLQTLAAFVTTDGRISVSGDFVNRQNNFSGGIRPALWLQL